MDKPRPSRLTRTQLGSFLPTEELIRAFEKFIDLFANLTPDELNALLIGLSTAQAGVDALTELAASQAEDQAAQLRAVSGEVQQLREQIAARDDSAALLQLSTQLAELRERSTGMKITRVIHAEVTIVTGNFEANYTITPALSSMSRALLIFNGSWNGAASPNGGAMLLTSTTNINYKLGTAVGTDLVGRFTLLEFEQ